MLHFTFRHHWHDCLQSNTQVVALLSFMYRTVSRSYKWYVFFYSTFLDVGTGLYIYFCNKIESRYSYRVVLQSSTIIADLLQTAWRYPPNMCITTNDRACRLFHRQRKFFYNKNIRKSMMQKALSY